jgi:hypothetical protein
MGGKTEVPRGKKENFREKRSQKMRKNFQKIAVIFMAFVMICTMTACQSVGQPEQPFSGVAENGATVGTGAKTFTVEVTDGEGKVTTFTVKSDAKTVGEALLALNIIAGDESQYGLYVKTVNGITADYDKDQTWWGFYIDGTSASAGVDSTDIVDGSTYGFKVEK